MNTQKKMGNRRVIRTFTIAGLLFGAIFGYYDLVDYLRFRGSCSQLTKGVVISRDYKKYFFGIISRPYLEISTSKGEKAYYSVLWMDSSKNIPDNVSFCPPGADDNEVQLIEEQSSLNGVLLFFGLPLLLFLYLEYLMKKYKAN